MSRIYGENIPSLYRTTHPKDSAVDSVFKWQHLAEEYRDRYWARPLPQP